MLTTICLVLSENLFFKFRKGLIAEYINAEARGSRVFSFKIRKTLLKIIILTLAQRKDRRHFQIQKCRRFLLS